MSSSSLRLDSSDPELNKPFSFEVNYQKHLVIVVDANVMADGITSKFYQIKVALGTP